MVIFHVWMVSLIIRLKKYSPHIFKTGKAWSGYSTKNMRPITQFGFRYIFYDINLQKLERWKQLKDHKKCQVCQIHWGLRWYLKRPESGLSGPGFPQIWVWTSFQPLMKWQCNISIKRWIRPYCQWQKDRYRLAHR